MQPTIKGIMCFLLFVFSAQQVQANSNDISFNLGAISSQITTPGQYTNIHIIGDSITNPNNGSAQGSLLIAMLRGWRTTDHCGLVLWQGDNNNGVQSILSGANFAHGEMRRASGVITGHPWDDPRDRGSFFGGMRQFGMETMRDRRTTGIVPAGSQLGGLALVDITSNDYPGNNDWFNNVPVLLNVAAYAESTGMQDLEIRGRRRNDAGTVSGPAAPLAVMNLRSVLGAERIATVTGLTIETSTGAWPYVNLATSQTTGAGETCVISMVRLYKTGELTGFEVSSSHGGGYKFQSYLHPTDVDVSLGDGDKVNNSDQYLAVNLEARGWPNVIWIALGANDGNAAINDPVLTRRRIEKVIERHAAAYRFSGKPIPHFVLQSPYACTNVSIPAADAFARIMKDIAQQGTTGHATPGGSPLVYAPVPGGMNGKISSINTRAAMAAHGPIANGWNSQGIMIDNDQGGLFMKDNIHPTQQGADAIMNTVIYNRLLGSVSNQIFFTHDSFKTSINPNAQILVFDNEVEFKAYIQPYLINPRVNPTTIENGSFNEAWKIVKNKEADISPFTQDQVDFIKVDGSDEYYVFPRTTVRVLLPYKK